MFNIFYFIFLITLPYYFFKSGIPQVAHLFMLSVLIYYIANNYKSFLLTILVSPYAIYFLLYVSLINSYYMLIYSDLTFLIYTFYYGFNIFLFYMTRKLIEDKILSIEVLAKSMAFSLCIQFILALILLDIDFSTRNVFFFNSPNQLGYFALLVAILYFVLEPKIQVKESIKYTYSFLIYGSSFFFIFLSSSTTALASFLLLILIIFIRYFSNNVNIKNLIIILILLSVSVGIIITSIDFDKKNIFIKKISFINSEINKIVLKRGYDRIINHSDMIIVGTGEGRFDRFDSKNNGELHSTLGNIIFSYGIFGLFLFILLIYKEVNIIKMSVFILPLLIYSITHNAIRNPLFWIILAVVITLNKEKRIINV